MKKSRFDLGNSDDERRNLRITRGGNDNDNDNCLGGLNDDHECVPGGRTLPWSADAKQRTHQNTKIVDCNMNEVSLVDVFTTAKPCAAHAAAFENMREAALNDLAALAHRLLADARSQPVAVRIDRGARLIVAMPT